MQAWDSDTRQGLISVMITADHYTATALNHAARQTRIDRGDIGSDGLRLRDGTTAGIGDTVITRRNDRTLRTGRSWVKNGDTWAISSIGTDGSLHLQDESEMAQVTIPADYVQQHVDLGYASTIHQIQGRTTDTGHAHITPAMQRNQLYVAATRGRQANHLYLDTSWDIDPDTRHDPSTPTYAGKLLVDVVERTQEHHWAASIWLDAKTTTLHGQRPTRSSRPNWTDAHHVHIARP